MGKDELDFLIKNYEIKGIKFCANHLGRTDRSVSYWANSKLGLYRNFWKSKGGLKNFKNVESKEVAYVLGFLMGTETFRSNSILQALAVRLIMIGLNSRVF